MRKLEIIEGEHVVYDDEDELFIKIHNVEYNTSF